MEVSVHAGLRDVLFCSGCNDPIEPPAKVPPRDGVHDLVPGWVEHLRGCAIAATGQAVQVLVRFEDDWDVRLMLNLPRRSIV